MVSYEFIGLIFTGLSISISIIYYASVLRNQNKTRQRDQVFQRIQTQDLDWLNAWVNVMFHMKAETVEEELEKYGPEKNPEAWVHRNLVITRYDLLGVMLKENMIDPNILYQIYKPSTILQAWSKFEPSIMILRERFNDPNWNSGFEHLYKETLKRFPNITHD